MTISSSSDCGGRSNTNRSICAPVRTGLSRSRVWPSFLTGTTAAGHISRWAGKRRTKPTLVRRPRRNHRRLEMQKRCTVDLWTAGYAGSRLTAQARSPMDKPWTTLRVAHRLPTGRRLPTSSTALNPIVIESGKVKTKTPAPALAYSSPVAVQTTGTTAPAVPPCV